MSAQGIDEAQKLGEQDSPTTVRLPRTLRRQQLILSALRVFSSQGYHMTTMNHIASAAEVTKPVLYQHFSSKQELYLAVLDAQIESLVALLVEPLQTIEVNRDKAKGMLGAFFEFARSNPQGYRLIFDSGSQDEVITAGKVDHFLNHISERIAEVLAPNTGLDQPDAILISRSLVSMTVAAAQHVLQHGGSDEDLSHAAEMTFRLAWGGISIIDEDWS